MPANDSSRPVATARRVAGLVAATLVLASLVVVALLGPGSGALRTGDAPLVVAAVVGVSVLVLALGILWRRQGRRSRRRRTRDALARFDGLHVCGVVHSRDAEPLDTETVSERVLRLQVRSLEKALEGEGQRLADAVRDAHREALLTVDALRGSLSGERGDIALNRVEAALRRLGVPPSFTRPFLGAAGTGTLVLPAPQPLADLTIDPTAEPVAQTSQTSETEAPVDTPSDTPADTPADDPADAPGDAPVDAPVDAPSDSPAGGPAAAAEPVTDPSPEPPLVRPVPAWPASEVPHRARRRLRRTVAA